MREMVPVGSPPSLRRGQPCPQRPEDNVLNLPLPWPRGAGGLARWGGDATDAKTTGLGARGLLQGRRVGLAHRKCCLQPVQAMRNMGPVLPDLPAARATPGKQRFCPPQGCELRQAAASCHTSGTPPPPRQTALLSPQVEQSELHRLNSISQGAVSYICPAAVGLILGRSPHLLVSVTPTPPSPAPCTFLKLTAF